MYLTLYLCLCPWYYLNIRVLIIFRGLGLARAQTVAPILLKDEFPWRMAGCWITPVKNSIQTDCSGEELAEKGWRSWVLEGGRVRDRDGMPVGSDGRSGMERYRVMGPRPRTFLDSWAHFSVPNQQEERWWWMFQHLWAESLTFKVTIVYLGRLLPPSSTQISTFSCHRNAFRWSHLFFPVYCPVHPT